MYEKFDFSVERFKRNLQNFPGLENLTDLLEIDYVGERNAPLLVSSEDLCVATVWYSAYLAEHIRKTLNKPHFLYLIQDYEAAFHTNGTHYSAARESYDLSYKPIFSTCSLQDFFVSEGIVTGTPGDDYVFFNNASSPSQISEKDFLEKKNTLTKKLVFYSRPTVERNMFLLGASSLLESYRREIFQASKHNWEFYGMGIGNVEIFLDNKTVLRQVPRMTLKEYQERMSDFDVCLTLMASPHPSIVPFDLAGSGALVITNTYQNKSSDYLQSFSPNIIACQPNRESLVNGIERAVAKADNLASRFEGSKMLYPKTWDETWLPIHLEWLQKWAGPGIKSCTP